MMKTFIKDKQYGRRLLSVLSMLAVAVIAWGDNITVSMSDFSIKPGETHTVAIDVTSNERTGSAFGGIIDLPAGLTFVAVEDEELMTKNADRCATDHELTYATKAENPALKDNQLKFSLFSFGGKNLKGTEGTVLSFKVKASDELAEDSKITILKCQVAGKDDETSVKCECSANVHNDAFVPTLMNLTAQPFNITPTKEYDLTFAFEKNKDVTAFQTDITLPDGMSFKMIDEDEEEYVKFDASRLANHISSSNLLNGGKTLRVILMSSTNKNIKLDEGNFFTVRVKADATLAENTEITVSKIEFAQSNGEKFNPADFTIAVSNPDIAAKAAADEKIAELKTDFESTKAEVAKAPESVQNLVKDDITILQEKIDAIDAALAQDVTNGDVAANTVTREAAITEASALLAALNTKLSDAKAAYEANEQQHTADLAAIEEVKKALEAAKTEIAEMAESVQTLVAEDIAAAETAVEALTTAAEASYAAGTSVADAEKLAADIEAAKAQIEALKQKATEAQGAYDANEKQHTADLAAIEEVKKALETAKTEIAEMAESVQTLVAEDIAAAETAVEALTTAAEASYAAGTSVADAEKLAADIEAAKAQIEALKQKATEAQGAYDANEKQHTADLAAIEEVKKALETAKTEIAEMAESVQTLVAEDIAAAETAVEALTTAAEASYAAGTSVADAEKLAADIEAAKAQIEALKQKATEAQGAYDANEKQHTADLAAIEEVKKALETAKTEIAEMAESVQTLVAEDIAAAETAVEALTTAAEASYAAGTSVADAEKLAADIEAAKAQIEALKQKATEAQGAYDANEKQHTADLEAIAEVQKKFDAVKEKIAGYDEKVQTLVAEDIADIQKNIDEAKATAEKSYEDGTAVADANMLKALLLAIESKISSLDNKAAIEQEKISTGISGIEADNNSNVKMFDLSGRRIKNGRGIVIINGKKRIVK